MLREDFSSFSDDELVEYVEGLHQAINVIGSYSMKDYLNCQNGIRELIKRGFMIKEVITLVIEKGEEDDD